MISIPHSIGKGSEGATVVRWQKILGITADGKFGEYTYACTRSWQREHGLVQDGSVGPKTWSKALSGELTAPVAPTVLAHSPLTPISAAERSRIFGEFDWSDDDGDGWIKIHGDWVAQNIVRIEVPELDGVRGYPGWMQCHRLAAPQFRRVFRGIARAGLINRIITFDGSFAARRIRRSGSTWSPNLSNHAWATAFDINAQWNYLGQEPAPIGTKGSLLEIVPICNANGFAWGGLFSRVDAMHFEVSELDE